PVALLHPDTAPAASYTLSLHDALPILSGASARRPALPPHRAARRAEGTRGCRDHGRVRRCGRHRDPRRQPARGARAVLGTGRARRRRDPGPRRRRTPGQAARRGDLRSGDRHVRAPIRCARRPVRGVPGTTVLTPGPLRAVSAADAVLLQQSLADDRLLDLAGALADQQEGRLAHEPLDLVLGGVAVAAVDAEGLLGHLGAVLARDELGHAGLDV